MPDSAPSLDWLDFFECFFREHTIPLARILSARDCRERWLQGQLYLFGQRQGRDIHIGSMEKKFDILCDEPPMVGEIKISGGTYAGKMKGWIEHDVHKLAMHVTDYPKYMILVVDNDADHTKLGKWLLTCDFPHHRYRQLDLCPGLIARLWELEDAELSR